MNEIRVAIAGVGNCASNLIQGIEYYSKHHNSTNGLMHCNRRTPPDGFAEQNGRDAERAD